MKLENVAVIDRPVVETEEEQVVGEFKPKQFDNFNNPEAIADLIVENIKSIQPTSTGKGFTTRQGMATRQLQIGDKTYFARIQTVVNLSEVKTVKAPAVNLNTIKQGLKSSDPKIKSAAQVEYEKLGKELGL